MTLSCYVLILIEIKGKKRDLVMNMPIVEKLNKKGLHNNCKEEIKECDKHDLIMKISEILGDEACKICVAEQIFDEVKYGIAQYVMKYECESAYYENEDVQFFLEEKSNPQAVNELNAMVNKFLI